MYHTYGAFLYVKLHVNSICIVCKRLHHIYHIQTSHHLYISSHVKGWITFTAYNLFKF